MAGIVRQYTEAEIGKILKSSENSGIGDGIGQGHAEGLHELVAVGRDRQSTSSAGLVDRLFDERKSITGAFDNCQVKAVAFALNTSAGQAALQYLAGDKVWYVFTKLDVRNQNFKMIEATANAPSGRGAQGPLSNPKLANVTVACVAMKLMRTGNSLHIRTAYPMSALPNGGQSTCSVTYAGNYSVNQVLAV